MMDERSTSRSGERQTILVVEDEEIVLEVIGDVLRVSGYRVLSARSAHEALRLVQTQEGRLDLLLTDVVMPGLSGIELAAELKRTHPETRVLFMSGYLEQPVLLEGVAVVEKPIRSKELLARVREVLSAGDTG